MNHADHVGWTGVALSHLSTAHSSGNRIVHCVPTTATHGGTARIVLGRRDSPSGTVFSLIASPRTIATLWH